MTAAKNQATKPAERLQLVGVVHVGGVAVGSVDRRTLARRIQPVFQDPYSSLNPRKTLASIVALPLAVLGIGTVAERQLLHRLPQSAASTL